MAYGGAKFFLGVLALVIPVLAPMLTLIRDFSASLYGVQVFLLPITPVLVLEMVIIRNSGASAEGVHFLLVPFRLIIRVPFLRNI